MKRMKIAFGCASKKIKIEDLFEEAKKPDKNEMKNFRRKKN